MDRSGARVLLADFESDGEAFQDEAKKIARALRDAGLEVIAVPRGTTPELIAAVAVQEDVAAVVIRSSPDDTESAAALRSALAAAGAGDIAVHAYGHSRAPASAATGLFFEIGDAAKLAAAIVGRRPGI